MIKRLELYDPVGRLVDDVDVTNLSRNELALAMSAYEKFFNYFCLLKVDHENNTPPFSLH